jgi:uncharacterized protein (TIGR01777 family)
VTREAVLIMRVFIAGATGFIGRALVPRLHREGHTVVAWVRSEQRARNVLGAEVETLSTSVDLPELARTLAECDAVVNLAGEPLMGGRWTDARRRLLESSRIDVTERIVHALATARRRPAVLVSGSAVGYYGDRGADTLDEMSPPGRDFLASLCQRWETAALEAEALGIRVVRLRTGVVLGRDGGALASMLPAFRIGAGGPVGSGKQYFPWIHLHDLVGIIAAALGDERYAGAINGVAPEQATSRDFARALGRALRRPAFLPLPALALRAIFGEAAVVLLASQRVAPRALQALGYRFAFPLLDGALEDILGGTAVSIAPVNGRVSPVEPASRRYLEGRPPAYELRTTTTLDVPLETAFRFFSQAENLGALTPPAMGFAIDGRPPVVAEGATIDYRLRVGPVPIRWRTLIASFEPGRRFVDLQAAGPYHTWWHEHSFRADGRRTIMEDRVYYTPPLGVLGRMANRLFIVPTLRRIFQYRGDVIRLRFG